MHTTTDHTTLSTAPDPSMLGFTGEQHDPTTELIHLRARDHDPGLGRFTRPDPVTPPVGTPDVSAYVYANNQPGVYIDPTGMVVESFGTRARNVSRYARNAPVTIPVTLAAEASGADCTMEQGLHIICPGAHSALYGRGGTQLGNTLTTCRDCIESLTPERREALLRHERRHIDQWATFGPAFAPLYLTAEAIQGKCNIFEADAGFQEGGYTKCAG